MLKTCTLFGFNVLTKGRILSGFYCLSCLSSSWGMLSAFCIPFSIICIGYSCFHRVSFNSSKCFFLVMLFSTMTQILLASVNGIFLLQWCGWFDVNGTYLRVSVCLWYNSIHIPVSSLLTKMSRKSISSSLFGSRIICTMICESMLSTKMQKLLQCTVALVNQTALRALCFFFKQTGT